MLLNVDITKWVKIGILILYSSIVKFALLLFHSFTVIFILKSWSYATYTDCPLFFKLKNIIQCNSEKQFELFHL